MAKRNERLVFNGKIFKVYQWRQRMFDGSYKTFERVQRPASVQIIPTFKGKVAIALESQPDTKKFLGFIGGRVDEGESPLHAAKRELLEESGMVARKWKLLKKFGSPSRKLCWDVYLFAALDCEMVKGQQLDDGERIKIKLIKLNELLKWRESRKRVGADIALYFTKLHYDPKLRRRFARNLGL